MQGREVLRFNIDPLYYFSDTCEKLGTKTAKKAGRRAASKGAAVLGKAVRANLRGIPKRSGELRKGIKRRQEKTWRYGKYVYDYMFDPAKNAIFQKPIKEPGLYGGKSNHAYYPSSMEYGFLVRKKGGGLEYVSGYSKGYNGTNADGRERRKMRYASRKVDGYHFMRDAVMNSEKEVFRVTEDTLIKELDKEWSKHYESV